MVEEATAHMAHISDPYRARTFLGVVVELASTLKSIFSPFYVYVVDHLLSYLLHEVFFLLLSFLSFSLLSSYTLPRTTAMASSAPGEREMRTEEARDSTKRRIPCIIKSLFSC